jgi:hypothetical protein
MDDHPIPDRLYWRCAACHTDQTCGATAVQFKDDYYLALPCWTCEVVTQVQVTARFYRAILRGLIAECELLNGWTDRLEAHDTLGAWQVRL